ncbi:MAG: crotonase/enoyl-CoA hydratase family protein [Syntrophomonadaceae bacterium]|nr:crotonase/enoyl-CoA hydratase family protein [Syntrophomonadaceae bacterium]
MSDIIVERRGHILLIGFNRPQKRNSLTLDMYYELARAYGELSSNKELRCGLLYAVGDHFTSGLDLPQWGPVFAGGKWIELKEGMIDPFGVDEDNRCKKPIVMACQGYCYTIGFELLLAADVRVAARDVRLAQLEVKRAIFPVGGATVRMFEEIGWGNAMRYLLTGDELSGPEAYRLGLVQELVEPGEQFDRALEIAERISKAAPLGVQGALASARRARVHGPKAALTSMFQELQPLMSSKDSQEGLKAFLERREPNFTGE